MSFCVPYLQKSMNMGEAKYMPGMWWLSECSFHDYKGEPQVCGWKKGGLFRDWHEPGVWLCLTFLVAQSWCSGLLVKTFSSLVKLLGKVVSVGLIYFVADLWLTRPADAYPISFGATIAA